MMQNEALKDLPVLTEKINAYLDSVLPASGEPEKGLEQAMRYSLMAGGKRIRPLLALLFAKQLDADLDLVLPAACAVEMIHTYSLIHDDLPCMDNDTLRRGKPTNHVIYGECTATLAGDALQAEAFRSILSAELPWERKGLCARILSEAVGVGGMCGGQYLDMLGERLEFDVAQVTTVHNMKTAAMIIAACRMGAILGGDSEKEITAAENYAKAIGLAFQIRDDILDVTSSAEVLGKPVFSDEENGKSTFVSLLGIEKCEKIVSDETEKAKKIIKEAFVDDDFFCDFADYLCSRKS